MPGWSRTPPASATSSSRDALRDGTGWPAPSLWVGDCEVEKPERAGGQRVVQQRDHLLDLLVGGLAADGVAAHRRQPKRRVTDQEAGVDGDTSIEPVEPVAERLPVPVAARPAARRSGMPSTRASIRVR